MKNYQDKTWLKKKYLDEKLSTIKIAELCGLHSHVTILDLLNKFKIKRRTLSEARRLWPASGMLGKHHSKETREKIGDAFRGKKIGPFSEKHRKNISKARKGRFTGENNPHWKGGVSFERWGREFSHELKNKIRKRDGFKCQKCGKKEDSRKHLVHHIDFNPRNNSVKNLILLCRACHTDAHRGKENGQIETKR